MSTFELWREYLVPLLRGLLVTAEITALSLILAVLVGAFFAWCRMANSRLLRASGTIYVEVVRGTPMLVVLLVAYYGLGEFGILIPPFQAAVLSFGFFYGALFAEVFRGAIESIDRGQGEAADALGMSPFFRLRKIILPQATIPILLPSTNTLADLVKDTSLVVVIGLVDLTGAASEAATITYRPMDMYALAGLLYLALNLFLSRVLARWELNVQRRHH